MFKDLVRNLAAGSELHHVLVAASAEWPSLSDGRGRRFGSLDQYTYALWSDPARLAFPWHDHTDVLAPLSHPFTAQVIFKSPFESVSRSWELVGFNEALRRRLAMNLQSIESIPAEERDADVRLLHCEIVTAFRIEELAMRRQAEQLQDFLTTAGCTVLQVRGLDDDASALRRAPFAAYAVGDLRRRVKGIVEQLFATTSSILAYEGNDPQAALRASAATDLIAFHPEQHPSFEPAPLLKAECELYLQAGVVESDVEDLRRTIDGVAQVLSEHFGTRHEASHRASA